MLNWIKSITKKKTARKKASSSGHEHKRGGKRGSIRGRTASAEAGRHEATILSRSEHCISRDDIDSNALKVLYRLHKAGYQACLVGGAVRDLLLRHTPKDFDVATDATPEQVNKLFRNCRLIGRRFRLAHIHFGRQIIEVATYRTNHDLTKSGVQNESGRIMQDNVFGALADDVWRRDFTANALYYDISSFSVIDYVDGYEDIKKRRLHLIGDAETRYREDPVRMLRALRFSAKLDFDIDEDSESPIHTLGHLLTDIPAARLYEEALKLFHSGYAARSFELLLEFDLLQYLFPEAAKSIRQDESVKQMIIVAMQNTDDRIRNDMRVTPAFLLAVLLWHAVDTGTHKLVEKGMPYSIAIQKAATKVLSQQSSSVSIPRRFTSTMRDIWGLQTRFHYRAGKRAMSVIEHAKFRAGYDFLCIRAQATEGENGDSLKQDCKWWTDLQSKSAEQQANILFSRGKKAGRKKSASSRTRQTAKKKKAGQAESRKPEQ